MKLAALAAALGLTVVSDATDDVIGAQIQASYETLKTDAAKPPVETTKTVTIAASNDPPAAMTKQLNTLVLSNRGMHIDKLLGEKRITTAEAKKLKEEFCSETLSLSSDREMSFSTVMSLMGSREPLKALASEATGSQIKPTSDNPLVKLTSKMGSRN